MTQNGATATAVWKMKYSAEDTKKATSATAPFQGSFAVPLMMVAGGVALSLAVMGVATSFYRRTRRTVALMRQQVAGDGYAAFAMQTDDGQAQRDDAYAEQEASLLEDGELREFVE